MRFNSTMDLKNDQFSLLGASLLTIFQSYRDISYPTVLFLERFLVSGLPVLSKVSVFILTSVTQIIGLLQSAKLNVGIITRKGCSWLQLKTPL